MSWKTTDRATRMQSKSNLSFDGSGRVSVPVASIVSSSRVQRQVNAVREIAASLKRVHPDK